MSILRRILARSSVVERGPVKPVVVGSNPTVPAKLGSSSGVEHRTLIPTVGGSSPPFSSISRRAFLGCLGLTGAAAVVAPKYFLAPKGGWPRDSFFVDRYVFETKDLAYKSYERFSAGWTDPRALYGTKGMTAAEFRKIVEPELNRVFSEAYSNHSEEWKQVFGDDGVSLNSQAHPGSEPFAEEDRALIENDGWKCINGHPYCNLCASPVDLSEDSLERALIDLRNAVDMQGKRIRLEPREAWFLKDDNPDGLKLFERQKPILIRPGRRWFRA